MMSGPSARWRRCAAIAVMLCLGNAGLAQGRVTTTTPGRGCERSLASHVAFSGGRRPDTLTVRATGPACGRAVIVVTVRDASHRILWREQVYLGLVESGRFPGEPAPDTTFEHVIAVVENWVTLENTGDAPAWPPGDAAGADPVTQYETKLDRPAYERIRAAHEPMACIPVGPESAHCVAIDPATRVTVAFLSRGV